PGAREELPAALAVPAGLPLELAAGPAGTVAAVAGAPWTRPGTSAPPGVGVLAAVGIGLAAAGAGFADGARGLAAAGPWSAEPMVGAADAGAVARRAVPPGATRPLDAAPWPGATGWPPVAGAARAGVETAC